MDFRDQRCFFVLNAMGQLVKLLRKARKVGDELVVHRGLVARQLTWTGSARLGRVPASSRTEPTLELDSELLRLLPQRSELLALFTSVLSGAQQAKHGLHGLYVAVELLKLVPDAAPAAVRACAGPGGRVPAHAGERGEASRPARSQEAQDL